MKLYESPSPNAQRVQVFMKEKGIDCERVAVDLRAAENISEAFLAKNPSGRVPVLELDDGTFISETVAISRYLEALHPQPNLFGDDALSMAKVEMWHRRVEINFLLNVAMAFRNITGFFKDRETCVSEWGEVAAGHAVAAVPMFEAQLGQHEYLAGDKFSIADITLAIGWGFAQQVKVVPLPESPNIERWLAQVQARPSFQVG